MKAMGIMRRIDNLGRVVIPKEIRRTLCIREGDALELFTDCEGKIILRKYSHIRKLGAFAKEYAESLFQSSGHITCIIDKDQIIAVSGGPKKEFLERYISADIKQTINQRKPVSAAKNDPSFVSILEEDNLAVYNSQYISPIIVEGDVVGAIVFLSQDKQIGEVEGKLALTAAGFLGKQMEY